MQDTISSIIGGDAIDKHGDSPIIDDFVSYALRDLTIKIMPTMRRLKHFICVDYNLKFTIRQIWHMELRKTSTVHWVATKLHHNFKPGNEIHDFHNIRKLVDMTFAVFPHKEKWKKRLRLKSVISSVQLQFRSEMSCRVPRWCRITRK